MDENNLKIEYQGFLYVALNQSLEHRKNLGLIAFSHFVNDCLNILTQSHKDFQEIDFYQYRGHGVLYTWKDLANSSKAIEFINSFYTTMEAQQTAIKSKYKCKPKFTAAFHIGEVVEGGNGQQRIFFGEAINETCKLQALCAHYEQQSLFSERMQAYCKNQDLQFLSRIYLKGSPNAMDIYGL